MIPWPIASNRAFENGRAKSGAPAQRERYVARHLPQPTQSRL